VESVRPASARADEEAHEMGLTRRRIPRLRSGPRRRFLFARGRQNTWSRAAVCSVLSLTRLNAQAFTGRFGLPEQPGAAGGTPTGPARHSGASQRAVHPAPADTRARSRERLRREFCGPFALPIRQTPAASACNARAAGISGPLHRPRETLERNSAQLTTEAFFHAGYLLPIYVWQLDLSCALGRAITAPHQVTGLDDDSNEVPPLPRNTAGVRNS